MASVSPPRQQLRLSGILSRGFQAYFDRFGDWMPPMLLAALIALAAYVCCLVPFLIVAGPLACGLDYCAINAIRGRTIEVGTLKRGRHVAGSAILAYWALQLLYSLPVLLIVALGIAALAADGVFQQGLFVPPPNPPGGQNIPVIEQRADEILAEPDDAGTVQEERFAPPAQQVPQEGGPPAGNPDGSAIAAILTFYAVAIIGSLVGMVWMFWLSTRLIFVLPLIADRQIGVREAFRLSWESTRSGFWELLLLNLLAGVAISLGMQLCYVGMIFTLPAAFTLIASAYVERFPEEAAEPVLEDLPIKPGETTAT